MKHAPSPRQLVWATLIVMIVLIIATSHIEKSKRASAVSINTAGQPTIGSPEAKVQLVVFEEPKCSNCREYTVTLFDKLKKEYIDTGKIRYTIITVSFLPNSMPAAEALLCVHNQDPKTSSDELFFTYIDYLYHHQPLDEEVNWATPDQLLADAKNTSAQIDRNHLKRCLEKQMYRSQVDANTNYGRTVMNGALATPTIYINGVMVKDLTYDNLERQIKRALKEAGVK